MPITLLQADEETDPSAYGAYLRAQSDADLLDVARHLDPDRYPARSDAAAREVRRRRLWQAEAFTAEEMAVRRLALAAFALAGATLALAFGLTPVDAAGPTWPTGDMMPDGTPMSEVLRLFAVSVVRGVVVWGARSGVCGLLLLGLGGWACGRARAALRGRIRGDAWRLAALSLLALVVALGVASGPQSSVPLLSGIPADASPWDRALPFWDPFAAHGQTP